MVQRLLSAKDQSQSRKALFASWIVIFVQFTLFLTIGMLLWVLRDGKPIEGSAGPALSGIYLGFAAGGNRGAGDGGDYRCSDGEFVCRIEFTGFCHGGGLL